MAILNAHTYEIQPCISGASTEKLTLNIAIGMRLICQLLNLVIEHISCLPRAHSQSSAMTHITDVYDQLGVRPAATERPRVLPVRSTPMRAIIGPYTHRLSVDVIVVQ